jgi:D-3-phosphoglycerate dehydrogenase
MPRVLVSDKLSTTAAGSQGSRRRGRLPARSRQDKEKLLEIIGQYDGLAIRSATKVTS